MAEELIRIWTADSYGTIDFELSNFMEDMLPHRDARIWVEFDEEDLDVVLEHYGDGLSEKEKEFVEELRKMSRREHRGRVMLALIYGK